MPQEIATQKVSQANEDPQVKTLQATNIKPDVPQQRFHPRAGDVLSQMKSGATPLDFIRNNMSPGSPFDPSHLIKAEEEKRAKDEPKTEGVTEVRGEVKKAEPEKGGVESIPYDLDPKHTEVKEAAPEAPKENEASAPKSEDEILEAELDAANAGSAAENFKRLRTKTKEALKALTELQAKNAAIEKELQSFKTGEVIPEVLKEKETQIQELSYYQKLHNLKTSKEYQDSFVKPLSEIQQKLSQFATDYSLPPEELDKALNIKNSADLNRFLSEHFDQVGALEVKQLINQATNIREKAFEAEKEPSRILAELRAEHAKVAEEQNQIRKSKVFNSSKEAWAKSLLRIRDEGKVLELIPRDSDSEFNDKVVKPTVTQASNEFSKIVTMLGESGLEQLTPELAEALAKMTLLAHATAIAVETRNVAIKHATELERNITRTNGMMRPSIGSSGSSTKDPGAMPQTVPDPREAAGQLIQGILASRG